MNYDDIITDMHKYKPAFLSALILLASHSLAVRYGWYVSFSYYDILMHLLGGVAVGLLVFTVATSLGYVGRKRFAIVIIGVVAFGIGWELFEIIFDMTSFPIGTNMYFVDTTKDMINDIIGGIIAFNIIKNK